MIVDHSGRLAQPEELNLESGKLARNWRKWQQQFEVFSITNIISESVQAATLLAQSP